MTPGPYRTGYQRSSTVNTLLKRPRLSLASLLAPVLCMFVLTGCLGPSIERLGTTNGTYSRQLAADRINMLSRSLALFYDRVGPVLANDNMSASLLFTVAKDYVFGETEAKRQAGLTKINEMLEDDDKLVDAFKNLLSIPRSDRNGNVDRSFLGQWGIKQTDELLEAYIRSQLTDVRGKEPSEEARKWVKVFFHAALYDESKAMIDLLPLIDPTRDIVTPGLGT